MKPIRSQSVVSMLSRALPVIQPLEVRRLLSGAGDLDVSFGGGDGRVLYDQDIPSSMIALASGKLFSAEPTYGGLELRRYNSDGSPDVSFSGGSRTLYIGTMANVDLVELVGGKILAVGGVAGNTSIPSSRLIARLNPDGTLDTTFGGGDGIVFGPAGSAALHDPVVRGDGRIVAAGGIDQVYRLNADGSLDTAFGTAGVTKVVLPALPPEYSSGPLGTLEIQDLALAPDNRIVVSGFGSQTHYAAVAQLSAGGKLDTSFNDGLGYFFRGHEPPVERVPAVAVQSDGRIVFGVDSEDGGFIVQRLLANGKLDPSFGGRKPSDGPGEVYGAFGIVGDYAYGEFDDLLLQPDGKIVVTGGASQALEQPGEGHPQSTQSSVDFSVIRYNVDGTRDASFNGGVTAIADFTDLTGDRNDSPDDLLRMPDGDFVVAGVSRLSSELTTDPATRFALARFQGTAGGPSSGVAIVRHDVDVSVTGTDGSDELAIRARNGVILVEFNGNVQRLDASRTYGFVLDGRGGADVIGIDIQGYNDMLQYATLLGGAGDDVMNGSALPEVITGGDGNDTLHGNVGNDSLDGGNGNDAIFGDAGNDALTGGSGGDYLSGADGDDRLDGGSADDVLDGGAGIDTADYHLRGYSFRISLNDKADDTARSIGETDNVHSNVENVIGGSGSDRITGSAADNLLHGGAGNDTLDGGTGNDVLYGDGGVDTADYSQRGYGLNITLNDKPDDGPRATVERDNVHSDIENVIGGSGNDYIVATFLNNRLEGGPGNDTIWAGEGNDTLIGGPGADALFGQGGNDTLFARDGTRDTVNGGGGVDSAQGDNGTDLVQEVETILA